MLWGQTGRAAPRRRLGAGRGGGHAPRSGLRQGPPPLSRERSGRGREWKGRKRKRRDEKGRGEPPAPPLLAGCSARAGAPPGGASASNFPQVGAALGELPRALTAAVPSRAVLLRAVLPRTEPSQAEPCCAEPQPRCPRSTRPSPAAPAGLGRAAAHHVGPARRLGVGRVTQGEEELPCLALPCPALTRTACIPRVLRACLLLPWKPPPSVQPRVPLPRTRCPAPGSFPRSSPVCIPASWLPFCLQASLPLPGHAPLLPCAGLPLQSHFLCPERAPGWC